MPAVVIYTAEPEEKVRAVIMAVTPSVAPLIVSIVKRGKQGDPGERWELHCKQTDLDAVVNAVKPLKAKGLRVKPWLPPEQRRVGSSALANTSVVGHNNAIRAARVCKEYYFNLACSRGSNCKFKCYGSMMPQYPLPLH